MKKQIEKMILSMVDRKFQTTKFREDFYTDIKDIVDTIEDMAGMVEEGRYSLTEEEVRAEAESFDSRV